MPAAVADSDYANDESISSTPYAQTLLLNTWPTCFDNVSWSADAIIAVALDEFIELLIPRVDFRFLTSATSPLNRVHQGSSHLVSRTADRVSARAPSGFGGSSASAKATVKLELENWTRVRVQVNSFRVDEWPYVEPQLFEDFDLGEEQSSSTVQRLAWSDEGLARNARCALGVLTSNGLLSIWTAEDKIGEVGERGWNRRFIVNDALREWFAGRKGAVNGSPERSREVPGQPSVAAKEAGVLHRRCRIRTFCWSCCPRHIDHLPHGLQSQAQTDYKDHILIVTNDYEEIVIIRAQSPYDNPLRSSSEWYAQVLGIIDTKKKRDSEMTALQGFDLKTGLHNIAISPWSSCKGEPGVHVATLSYARNNDIEVLVLKTTQSDDSIVIWADQDHLIKETGCDLVGPLHWISPQSQLLQPELFYCPRGQICRKSFQMQGNPIVVRSSRKATYERDDWSTVTGVAVIADEDGSKCFQYTPFMPSPNMPAESMVWSDNGDIDFTQSEWSSTIQDLQRSFSQEYKLFDHVATRCWGMTAAPNRRHVVTCFTLHPSDQVQYATNVQQDTHLAITDEMDHVVPSIDHGATSEMNMFSLYTWLWSHERYQDDPNTDRERLRHVLLGPHSQMQKQTRATTINDLVETIKNATTLITVILALRSALSHLNNLDSSFVYCLDNMTSHGSFRKSTAALNDTYLEQVMFTLITAVAARVSKLTESDQRLLGVYAQIAQRQEGGHNEQQNGMEVELSTGDTSLAEVCEICNAKIEFDDIRSARCQKGHQLARCALTKLAIQEPGISKFCGICNAQYLKDDVLQQEVMGELNGTREQLLTLETASLTQILSTAVERCLYCGGKFIG